MTKHHLADDAPATSLFPQFKSELYHMFSTEVEGLTDQELDFESNKWEWSKWSIRRNVSHVASGDFRWLIIRWGDQLFPSGPPDIGDLEGFIASPDGRWLDEDKYWDLDAILGKLRQGQDLCLSVLSKETVGSLKSKKISIENNAQRQLFSQAHPGGFEQDPNDSSHLFMTLEATFRHRYFEYSTHLYNIQRLKRAQGLTTQVNIPFVGYFALPDWDRSEP